MAQWEKKKVSKEAVKELTGKYGVDLLTASVLVRRGITKGEDLLFYLEDDERFLHNPFLFNQMEDAVDRILQAKEEGEKVLIFGDRDVDGVTSTTLLYTYLCEIGLDVIYRVPTGDEAYGLSEEAVNSFAEDYGSLIITVDCGISNVKEIALAAEKGIDVIVVDHHNPQEEIPEPAIIINPKLQDEGYPFMHISGCAVAYKLVTALRFAATELYKNEICLLNVRPMNEGYCIECIKTQNLVEKDRLTEVLIPGVVSIEQTRLMPFLRGQQIFVWDSGPQQKMLSKVFGNGIEFNFLDIRPEISKVLPGIGGMSLLRLKAMSKISRYTEGPSEEIDAFFNLFVTFVQKKTASAGKQKRNAEDLQLVALAALADIMPLVNENRILVRQGIAAMNGESVRPGIQEILLKQNLIGRRITSTDLSWNVIPVLNAAGRLGQPELAIELLMAKESKDRLAIAERILELNRQRRQMSADGFAVAKDAAWKTLERFSSNFVVAVDERINRGVTGHVANQLAQVFKVPAMVITFLPDNTAVGSVRSARGYDITGFLDSNGDLFNNHGGHPFAAGFSLKKENVPVLLEKLERFAPLIEFPKPQEDVVSIDAELPHEYMKPEILELVDRLEPYGELNPQLNFLVTGTRIAQADVLGKTERTHLKLLLAFGQTKWPAMYWGASQRLKRDFDEGDSLDVVFQLSRNYFNGKETPQMMVTDAVKSGR